MKINRDLFAAIVLTILFTLVFFYILVALPEILHEILLPYVPDPYFSGWETQPLYDSIVEEWSPIGSILFLLLIFLIVLGVIIKRFKLSSLGSFTLYLPIFANFCFIMLSFAGIGLIRLLWYPILQNNPQIFLLGDFIGPLSILFEDLIRLPTSLIPLPISIPFYFLETLLLMLFVTLLYCFVMIGIGIFMFSIITWFYGKFSGKNLLDFWIYKYSRHPQYLGFLIWNYGLIGLNSTYTSIAPGVHGPNPIIFWLISALFIIGAAIQEEQKLRKELTEEHELWRKNIPFLLPLPSRITNGMQWFVKRLINKDWPSNYKEILIVLAFFGLLIVLINLLFSFIVFIISDIIRALRIDWY
ncbi:MAG: hypothetical protein ACW97W_13390 [Candidatus Hodarchaeales archaeon]|jgi:protein-S-isoprenylcysteine O-methyltransferase Ste14